MEQPTILGVLFVAVLLVDDNYAKTVGVTDMNQEAKWDGAHTAMVLWCRRCSTMFAANAAMNSRPKATA